MDQDQYYSNAAQQYPSSEVLALQYLAKLPQTAPADGALYRPVLYGTAVAQLESYRHLIGRQSAHDYLRIDQQLEDSRTTFGLSFYRGFFFKTISGLAFYRSPSY